MQLHQIRAPKGANKRRKIVGRGRGSGSGKTSGRGENGQRSRSGRWCAKASEGGQMRLIRRLPKVGFRSHRPILYQVVNVGTLEVFETKAEVNRKSLKKLGLISSVNKPVKILGVGELTKALKVKVDAASGSAQEIIKKAGGEFTAHKGSLTTQTETAPAKK